MHDSYQILALILTALLLPAFGYLYLRFRDTRTMLWFLGFLFAIVRMLFFYRLGWWDFSNDAIHPWLAAAGQVSIQISSALFLASLSPLSFRVGRLNILYVIPFTIPLVAYSILFYGFFHGVTPKGSLLLIFPTLGLLSIVAGFFWGIAKGSMPEWVGVCVCVLLGGIGIWICFTSGADWPLTLAECAMHFMTALLLIF